MQTVIGETCEDFLALVVSQCFVMVGLISKWEQPKALSGLVATHAI